jgi:hypothetical protein
VLKSVSKNCKVTSVARFSTSCIKFLEPDYTTATHPSIQRGPYAHVTDKDISFFEGLLLHRVIKGREGHSDDLDEYNVDWLQSFRGELSFLSIDIFPPGDSQIGATLESLTQTPKLLPVGQQKGSFYI